MRQIRTSGSMSGRWKRGTGGYSGTGNRKGRQTRMASLTHRATSRLYVRREGLVSQWELVPPGNFRSCR